MKQASNPPRLSLINERLSLVLESARQVAFEWYIPDDQLYFGGGFIDILQELALDTTKVWRSSAVPGIIHDADKENFRSQLHSALKGDSEGAIYKTELRLRDELRAWRWVEISGKIVERDCNGRAVRMVGAFSDIDERKQAEQKACRLRDLYAVLSQTNQAIVRIHDREDLFNEICRISVEHGKFHMAWIGLASHGGKQIVPAAVYGSSLGAPDRIAASIGEPIPAGHGVIGTAIRENRATVCNNLVVAPALEFCRKTRQASPQPQIQSVASIPIQNAGQPLGTLNLYSTEKDFFDAPLLDLLEQMAQDISFAIDNYERDMRRKTVEAALADSEKFKSAILTAALDCIISINRDGEIISFNQAAETTFGYRSEDVIGERLVDMIIPHERRWHHQRDIECCFTAGENSILNRRIELTAMRADRSTFPVEMAIVPLSIQDDQVFTAFIRDISELKQRQAALKDSAMRYRQLIELSPEAIVVYSDGKLAFANQAACLLLGAQNAGELLGKRIVDFVHADNHEQFYQQASMRAAGMSSRPFAEQSWKRLDGTELCVEIAATGLMYGDSPSVQVVVRDITERKHAEELQLAQNRILNMVATGVPLATILTEITRLIEAGTGRAGCSIVWMNADGVVLSEDVASGLPSTCSPQSQATGDGAHSGSHDTATYHVTSVIIADRADNPPREAHGSPALRHGLKASSSWPICGKNGEPLGTLALYFNEGVIPTANALQLLKVCTGLAGIAIESRASEEKIRYLAHYDGLTSLPNRFLFGEYLDLALRNAKRHAKKFAVFFLDLDKFKEINDTLGHDAGDAVLQEVAARLRSSLRHTDKIARMGGDEFYVLIEDLTDGRYAEDIARKLLNEACRPVRVNDNECYLSASIGIALYPDDGRDGQSLLKNADSAMYCAKGLGKNGYQFFSPCNAG